MAKLKKLEWDGDYIAATWDDGSKSHVDFGCDDMFISDKGHRVSAAGYGSDFDAIMYLNATYKDWGEFRKMRLEDHCELAEGFVDHVGLQ